MSRPRAHAGDPAARAPSRRSELGTRSLCAAALGSPRLFAIIWTSLASAIYFSLGVVAEHALGLTPVVFLIAAAVLRADRADLRRGRVDAPGARRLDGVRALRVQRARELHRRLGDPARLRDPDRDLRAHRDRIPRRLLVPRSATAPRRCCCRSRSSPTSCSRTSRGFVAGARAAARGDRDRRPRDPAARDRRSAWSLFFNLPTITDADPPRQRADLGRRDLRADDHDRRVHEPRVGVRACPARSRSAARGAAAHGLAAR